MNLTPETQAMAQAILDYHDLFDNQMHDQATWVGNTTLNKAGVKSVDGVETNICGTTMCAAGTAVFLSMPLDEFKKFANPFDDSVQGSYSEKGRKLLGLTWSEADVLFHAGNNKARRILERIAAGDEDAFL